MSGDEAAAVWAHMCSLVLDNVRREEVTEALGMSFFRVKALRRIAAATAPIKLAALASKLNTDRPYLTLVVDDLTKRGLVVRTPHPTDRRSKLVSVTPAGAEAAAEADRILGTPPQALRQLDEGELKVLAGIMEGLLSDPRATI